MAREFPPAFHEVTVLDHAPIADGVGGELLQFAGIKPHLCGFSRFPGLAREYEVGAGSLAGQGW